MTRRSVPLPLAGPVPAGPWRTGDAFATVFGPPNGAPAPDTIARLTRPNRALACLLAAAPDLYDACGLAIATIERLDRHGSAIGTLDVLRAALARAGSEVTR